MIERENIGAVTGSSTWCDSIPHHRPPGSPHQLSRMLIVNNKRFVVVKGLCHRWRRRQRWRGAMKIEAIPAVTSPEQIRKCRGSVRAWRWPARVHGQAASDWPASRCYPMACGLPRTHHNGSGNGLSCGDSASLQIPPNVGRFEKSRSRGRQDVPRLSPKFRALQRLLIELGFIIGIPRDLFLRGVRNLIFCSSHGTHSALKASAYRYG
jgi:hypothetical protein